MKRRIILWLLLVLAVSIVTLWQANRCPAPCPVDVGPEGLADPKVKLDIGPESCGKLTIGMSESEVEAILGGPAGDYRTREGVAYVFTYAGRLPHVKSVTKKEWKTDGYGIHVRFGPDGKAILIMGAHGVDIPGKGGNPVLRLIRDLGDRPVTTAK